MIYISSDRHIGHKNILKYDKLRKFNSIEEHDEYIISEHEKIWEEHTLIFLWDICLWRIGRLNENLSRIKCEKIWVIWNHDNKWMIKKLWHHFTWVVMSYQLLGYTLQHFPPKEIKNWMKYVHWHDHKWYHHSNSVHWISYNWLKLIYDFEYILWKEQ